VPGRRAAAALGLALAVACALPAGAEVRVRWLGVAGFTLSAGETTLAHDPYLSRPGQLRTLFRSYVPDEAVLGRFVGAGSPAPELAHASVYLVGHSHYDHLGDVPWLALHSGGRVVGSATSAAIARAYGLPEERAVIASPGAVLEEGAFEVRVIASQHAKVFLGRVPLEGELTEPPEAPIHALSFKLGDARAYLVTERASGLRILLLSSANRSAAALEKLGEAVAPVDLVLAAASGRDPDYARDLVRTLRPRLVVPHHFDDFTVPIDDPAAGAPRDEADLAAFEQELRAAAASESVTLEVRRPQLFQTISISRREGDSRRGRTSIFRNAPPGEW
jgi:L-ascorbate metabolism protein UlaG (beta-lactamase superfamily)